LSTCGVAKVALPHFSFFGTVPVKQHEHFYGHVLRHCVEGVVGNSNKFNYFAKCSITIRSATAQQQNLAWNFGFPYADLLLTRLLPWF